MEMLANDEISRHGHQLEEIFSRASAMPSFVEGISNGAQSANFTLTHRKRAARPERPEIHPGEVASSLCPGVSE